MSTTGVNVDADGVVITSNGQNGILVAFSALAQAGDYILTEELTFPGVKSVANMLGLRIQGLPIDEHGVIPEALENACRTQNYRFLYLIPTIHNPTAQVMPPERRAALADAAQHHNLMIVEDNIAARCIVNPPAPIATLMPENTVYLTSLSKAVAPGLRIGYLSAPPDLLKRQASIVGASAWMATPISAELATRWIEDGTAEKILDSHRAEAIARLKLATAKLGHHSISATTGCHHIWLTLPEPWRAMDFTEEAKRRGIVIAPAEIFAAGRSNAPHAVRICIGIPRRRKRLDYALDVLAEILLNHNMRDIAMV